MENPSVGSGALDNATVHAQAVVNITECHCRSLIRAIRECEPIKITELRKFSHVDRGTSVEQADENFARRIRVIWQAGIDRNKITRRRSKSERGYPSCLSSLLLKEQGSGDRHYK